MPSEQAEPQPIVQVTAPTKEPVTYTLDDYSDLPSANRQNVEVTGRQRDPKTGRFIPAQPEDIQESTATSEGAVPSAPSSPAAAPPRHDPQVAAFAAHMGYSHDDIQATPPMVLIRIVAEEVMRRQQAQAHQPEPEPEPPLNVGLDESRYEPELIASVRAAHQRAAEAEKRAERLERIMLEGRAETFQEKFDNLCQQYPHIFGEGPLSGMTKGSLQARRRLDLYQKMQSRTRMSPAALSAAFDDEASLYGELKTQPEQPQVAPQPQVNGRITPEQWARAGVVPATQRQGSEPVLSRREQKIRDVAAKLRENGVPFSSADPNADNSDLPSATRS